MPKLILILDVKTVSDGYRFRRVAGWKEFKDTVKVIDWKFQFGR